MKHIFGKIFLGYLLVILLISGFFLVFSFEFIRTNYIETLSKDLSQLNLALEVQFTPYIVSGRNDELDSLTKFIGQDLKIRITEIAVDGTVLADSRKDPHKMENHGLRPEIIQAKSLDSGQSMRFSTTIKDELFYIAHVVRVNGKVVAFSRLSVPLSQIDAFISELRGGIFTFILVISLLALGGIWLFTRSVTMPVKKLTQAARSVAGGNFETKVYLTSKDELKNLADSFNNMTDRIKTLFQAVSSQKHELDGILKSIREPLLVLDSDGRILLHNEALSTLAGRVKLENMHFWEAIRDPEFVNVISRILKDKSNIDKEIELNDRFYIVSSSFIESKDETVIILYEVTELKRLEQMKKDFVVNVSHELRTPLTAIKGFIETLEDETQDENQKHYLSIIHRHTDRLINIVQDLLSLSSMEGANNSLVISDVDVPALLKNVLIIFEQKVRDKNLAISLSGGEYIPIIRADSFKLEQLFVNLIDNAVKYSDRGEIGIRLSLDKGQVKIEISDSGVGIPKESLDRIFERFYTVDKSRTRKLGGTGLGLSIVKHIVLLHDGNIRVESQPDKGTKFTIYLPVGN